MRVLLVDGNNRGRVDPSGASGTEAELVAAGHDVVRCLDEGHGDMCRGMPGGMGCPVDDGQVDVAVAVQALGGSPLEVDGVRCVVRHFIPLVTTGDASSPIPSETSPGDPAGLGHLAGLGHIVPVVPAHGPGGVVDAVGMAADIPLGGHGQVATAALRDVLSRHGVDASEASAEVRRSEGNTLRVVLHPAVAIDGPVAQASAVRVAAALRAYDTKASGVGVVLDGNG